MPYSFAQYSAAKLSCSPPGRLDSTDRILHRKETMQPLAMPKYGQRASTA